MSELPTIPLSLSDWRELRARHFLVVDKTELIPDLVTNYTKVFISKPRRFGKTTLVSMLDELFTHGDRSFEDYAIYGHWPETQSFPVIRLAFNKVPCEDCAQFELNLRDALLGAYELALGPDSEWSALLQDCAQLPYHQALNKLSLITDTTRVVFLLDEWDYPLSYHLHDPAQFEHISKVLRTFYHWLRELPRVRFALITGIMRYPAIFTRADVIDLSMDPKYAALLGYTQDDLLRCFGPYLDQGAQRMGLSRDELLAELTAYYAGFCCDYNAQVKRYNPWAINQFFQQVPAGQRPLLGHFWLNTGKDTLLIRAVMERTPYEDIVQVCTGHLELTADDLTVTPDMKLGPVLVLTGYLSIKQLAEPVAYRPSDRTFICSLTNQEVTWGWGRLFLQYALDHKIISTSSLSALTTALKQGDSASLCATLNEVLSALWPKTLAGEVPYRTLIALILNFCGYHVRIEDYDLEVECLNSVTLAPQLCYVIVLQSNTSLAAAESQLRARLSECTTGVILTTQAHRIGAWIKLTTTTRSAGTL